VCNAATIIFLKNECFASALLYFTLFYFIFAIFDWNRRIVGLEVTEEIWLPLTSQYRGFASGWRVIRHSLFAFGLLSE
jgi:hypothetical protein